MKKFIYTLVFSLFSVALLIAQPMPNQNPHNGGPTSTVAGGPTQNSISTASVDSNAIILTILSLVVVLGVVLYKQKKKSLV